MINQSYWVSLPLEVRVKLREALKIPISVATEVKNNQVVCDGSCDKDLAVISVEALQAFVKSDEKSFEALWIKALDKAERMVKGIPEPEEVKNKESKLSPSEEKLMVAVGKKGYTPAKGKKILGMAKKSK